MKQHTHQTWTSESTKQSKLYDRSEAISVYFMCLQSGKSDTVDTYWDSR